jgi:hypothetical protein
MYCGAREWKFSVQVLSVTVLQTLQRSSTRGGRGADGVDAVA